MQSKYNDILIPEVRRPVVSGQNVKMQNNAYRENFLRENRFSSLHLAFVMIGWFVFTLFACCFLFFFLHAKYSDELTRDVTVDMRNFRRKLQDHMKIMIDEEIQRIRHDLELMAPSDNDRRRPWAYRTQSTSPSSDVPTRGFIDPVVHPDIDDEVMVSISQTQNHEIEDKLQWSKIFKRSVSTEYSRSEKVNDKLRRPPEDNKLGNGTTADNRRFSLSYESSPDTDNRTTGRVTRENGLADALARTSIKLKKSVTDINQNENRIDENIERLASSNGALSPVELDFLRSLLRNTKENPSDFSAFVPSVDDGLARAVPAYKSSSCVKQEVVAAHFGADSSSFRRENNPRVWRKNDLVVHPTGEYKEWKDEVWHDVFQTSKHINYSNGRITMRNHGLYFVYAQIFFTELADINAFVIAKNNVTVFQCVTSTYGDRTKGELSNSCYTGGIVLCREGDEFQIRSTHRGRSVVLEPTRSFFGMFKIFGSSCPSN